MKTAELPPLIQQMTRPSFYPHPVPDGDVRLVQTHISYVLLAGEYAYKVKKGVDLGFLDFGTLERRRHFCEEELRLNQRGAPGLYLDVLPICEATPGRYRLGGGGRVVEYAARMRRFPQAALFVEQLRLGRLGESDMDELARVLAAYHEGATVAPPRYGAPEAVRAAVDDNYRLTERFVSPAGPQTPEQLADTRAFTDRFFDERREVLAGRVAAGRIRECHGDLHLGNICRWGGRLMLFDCIEFNDSFRYVDVMYDLAFPAMDLRAHGRADLANALVNGCAERSGDWEGLRVLPLYLCRQAYVRAKVNSLLSEEVGGGDDRRAALAAAAGYYRLAWEYTQPRAGQLLLTCGLPGAGKTTVARQLARRLDAFHIRSDAIRKHLAGVSLEARGGADLYTPDMSRRTYGRLLEIGIELALEGAAVILDATYSSRDHRAAVVRAAAGANVPVTVVYCVAPMDILRDRLEKRSGDVSDATPVVLAGRAGTFRPPRSDEAARVVTVDTARPLESQLAAVSD